MAIELKTTGNMVQIKNDGEYRVFSPAKEFNAVQAEWPEANTADAAGTLTFTSQTDAGSGSNILDIGAGQRGIKWNMGFNYINVVVAGHPANSVLNLYLTHCCG